jgi:hypothetical protein
MYLSRLVGKDFLKFIKRDTLETLVDQGLLRNMVTTDMDYKVRPQIISGAEAIR